jgi:hypothetical protein
MAAMYSLVYMVFRDLVPLPSAGECNYATVYVIRTKTDGVKAYREGSKPSICFMAESSD